MNEIEETLIRETLSAVNDPCRPGNIVSNNRVQGIVIRQGNVGFSIEIEPSEAEAMEPARVQAENAIRQMSGVISATAILTSHNAAPTEPPTAKPAAPGSEIPAVFSKIKHVIAVASGKGGVGKSTIAVNLALALQRKGFKTGLLDADIYGPSLPTLFNVTEKPDVNEDKKLLPVSCTGLLTMSIGYMVPPEQAMIWRGPMVQGALIQLLNDVAWPELDYLVIDLPPGTGDIQLTMAQRIPVTGALIVSTPHQLAAADVRRAGAMFARVNIDVIGLVENMAFMTLPSGEKFYPFGAGQSAKLAEAMGIPFLGEIPLTPDLQTAIVDQTTIFDRGDSEMIAAPFNDLADHITSSVSNGGK